jgi:hypothetical protein
MTAKQTLLSLYSFKGFRARSKLKGIDKDPEARVITLKRRQKKRNARAAGKVHAHSMIPKSNACAIYPRAGRGYFSSSNSDGFIAKAAVP